MIYLYYLSLVIDTFNYPSATKNSTYQPILNHLVVIYGFHLMFVNWKVILQRSHERRELLFHSTKHFTSAIQVGKCTVTNIW